MNTLSTGKMTPQLNEENYQKGFLVDEELMAGITADPDLSQGFTAFVLRHTTGEYLGYQAFKDLSEALHTLNQIPRSWTFEAISGGCGGGKCGTEGACGGGNCKVGACGTGKC